MATNQYVNNYTQTNEQDLQDDLVVEAIQMKGIDVSYLNRTLINYDYLYGEDPSSAFQNATVIEMYPAFVDGFGGSGDMITNFGLDIKDTATFICSKTRFSEELGGTGLELDKPKVGDLIFLPLTNSFLEITHVEDESPFYELGKQYVWEIKTSLFEFSYEDFNTGDSTIDDLLTPTYDPATETEPYGDNDEIQNDADSIVDFDPSNPFGVR
jgi:hypothetical protein